MTAKPVDTCVCVCCRTLTPTIEVTTDYDLEGPVCESCRVHLMVAVAQMKLGFVRVPNEGTLPVNIKGCYKGTNAGDNRL